MHPKRVENPNAKCPRHPRKEYRLLIEACWDQGAWCFRRKNGAIYVCHPDTSRSQVPIHQTPSKRQRTYENTVGMLRQKGFDL